jgi:hypothetical protein
VTLPGATGVIPLPDLGHQRGQEVTVRGAPTA